MLPWASVALASISGVVTVILLRMRLKFLRHVYDRAGDRKDLEIAGKVISPRWTAITEGRRREPTPEQRRAQLRRLPRPRPTTTEDAPDPRPAA
jgi:hypothetical protein